MSTTKTMSTYRRLSACRRRRRRPSTTLTVVHDERLRQGSLYIEDRIDDRRRLRLRFCVVFQTTFHHRRPGRVAGGNTGPNYRRADVSTGGTGGCEKSGVHRHVWRLYGVPLRWKVSRNDRVSVVCQSQPLCRLTSR